MINLLKSVLFQYSRRCLSNGLCPDHFTKYVCNLVLTTFIKRYAFHSGSIFGSIRDYHKRYLSTPSPCYFTHYIFPCVYHRMRITLQCGPCVLNLMTFLTPYVVGVTRQATLRKYEYKNY